jgi:hypothetical protein
MRRTAVVSVLLLLASCGGVGSTGDDGDDGDDATVDGAPTTDANDQPFSFFVTSLDTMRAQSGSQDGFGGNLGGLAGADGICQTAATAVGFGHKTWRAFLSTVAGPIHAIDRIGTGPWYDRNGRLVAMTPADLLQTRPDGDPATAGDLPDENGMPLSALGDAHDIMTGSNTMGRLFGTDPNVTCNDWTNAVGPGSENTMVLGHSWPAMSGQSWSTAHPARGCAPGVNLVQNGPGSGTCVGCSGGYGGIYCFALEP